MKTIKTVICKSGSTGWQTKLQRNYTNFEEFESYCELYNIHERLGYKTPANAWKRNPTIQGSVNPNDLRRINKNSVMYINYISLK